MAKTNKDLGKEVREHLIKMGVETPIVENEFMSADQKMGKIENYFDEIMRTLGLDLSDDSLKDTPKRVAKMYVN